MSLTKCPACANEVSMQALTCPQCGHPFRKRGDLANQSVIVIVGSIILVLLLVFFFMNVKLF